MRSRWREFTMFLPVILAFMLATPAAAIQYGEPDNGDHPYVGGLVYQVDANVFIGCSGTMVGSTTFLTAAHCYPDETFQLIGVTFVDEFVAGESAMISNSTTTPSSPTAATTAQPTRTSRS